MSSKPLHMPCNIRTETMNPDQIIFWTKLKNAVYENDHPFGFAARKGYAHIDQFEAKIAAGGKYALILEYAPGKRAFRIGIYIDDSTKSQDWSLLLSHKEEIEAELNLPENYQPVWCEGEKKPKTKRIQTVLPLLKDTDRDELIDEALPIIIRYKKVFPKYLPDLFN